MPKKQRRQRGQVKMLDSETARIRVPLLPVAGGPPRPYHHQTIYHTTEDAAWKRVNEILVQVDKGEYFTPSKITLSEFFPMWLEAKRRDGVRALSLYQYQGYFDRYIKPTLGAMIVSEIKPLDVRSLYEKLQDIPLSQKTLNYAKTMLRMMFDDMKTVWRYVQSDPSDGVKVPKATKAKRKKHVMLPEQVGQLVRASDGSLKDLSIIFVAYTGLRPSEMTGLKVTDLSATETHALVSIERRTLRMKQRWDTDEPKSEKGKRSIPFPLWLYNEIMEAVKRSDEKKWAGSAWVENGLLFPSPNGQPQDRGYFAWNLKALCRRAGLPTYFTPYSLRYTYSSLLYLSGARDKTIADQMGHSSIDLTKDVYIEVFPMMQKAASDRLDSAIKGTLAQSEADGVM